MTDKTCKWCKWWKAWLPAEQDDPAGRLGFCRFVTAIDDGVDDAGTYENFGCIHWKPKDSPNP